jgi:hypothetical protein
MLTEQVFNMLGWLSVIRFRYLLIFGLFFIGLLSFFILVGRNTNRSVGNVEVSPIASVSSAGTELSYSCEVGKSAFEVLDNKAEVEFDESSFGKLVTSINNQKQGNNKYWLYSVDGKEATVGASTYICQGGEQIKWELK